MPEDITVQGIADAVADLGGTVVALLINESRDVAVVLWKRGDLDTDDVHGYVTHKAYTPWGGVQELTAGEYDHTLDTGLRSFRQRAGLTAKGV